MEVKLVFVVEAGTETESLRVVVMGAWNPFLAVEMNNSVKSIHLLFKGARTSLFSRLNGAHPHTYTTISNMYLALPLY